MRTYLDRILEFTYERVEDEKRKMSFGDLDREAQTMGPTRPFLAAMRAAARLVDRARTEG